MSYISNKEITKIYNILQSTVDVILEQHKIDSFKNKKWIFINLKDFHKVYISTYNPSLFTYTEKKSSKPKKFAFQKILTIMKLLE